MQRSAIARNNVGPIAQETDRAYAARPAARNPGKYCAWAGDIKRLKLTQATAVTAIFFVQHSDAERDFRERPRAGGP